MSTRNRRRILEERFPNLHIAGMSPQYDPDLVAIDETGTQVANARLRLGFGAPPVVPYGQTLPTLPNFGLRDKLMQMFPILQKWLPAQPTRRR